MTDLDVSWDTEYQARPPILDVLPAALRQESRQQCFCQLCAPALSDIQRAAHERVLDDWRFTRVAWCVAHGYTLLDLFQAENGATS
jgi:hypothetical protein